MSRPSILLVPGAFGLPEFYTPLLDAVTAEGYQIQCLHLPSVGLSTLNGRNGPPPTMYNDAAFITEEAMKLADEGKDLILIAHSYGGVPVTQCLKGIGKQERQKQGKRGGVVNIAYMTCLVPALGGTAASVLANVPQEQQVNMTIDENGWLWHETPAATATVCLNHLSPEEGEAWIKKFPKHSAISYAGKLTYAGYKDAPVSYLLCEEDLCIPPNIQKAGIKLIEEESGKKVNVTSIRADHCPNHTATQQVVDWIVDMAGRAERGS